MIVVLITGLFSAAKADNKAFENYAQKTANEMQDAYNHKDAQAYGKVLDEFKITYDKLSADDKKIYAAYLIDGYYNYCCVFSLKGDKMSTIKYLNLAIKAGYVNYGHLLTDPDLENVRQDVGFKALVAPLRNVGDYLYILKKAAAYNTKDQRSFPAFTYQGKDNSNLKLLRSSLKLDSIAGKGNEVSQVLRLMYWLHDLVPHDGEHGNPTVKNALSMISVCKQENRGLNCRGLATVLNECYLSMGIPSRVVTCLPKDSLHIDRDCHVINVVYIESLKKWIWIDPTFCAYVMDNTGALLSIEEVRERVITGKPLIINPDANWNHKTSETKEDYLYDYMAKNLYMIKCATSSEYDLETSVPGKVISYVTLKPLDYFKQKPDKEKNLNPQQTSSINYNTNNPQLFWANPETAK